MLGMDKEMALDFALDTAKILCANPNYKGYPATDTAVEIAEYVELLVEKLSSKEG